MPSRVFFSQLGAYRTLLYVPRLLTSFVANALTMVLLAALALSFGIQDFIEGSVIAAVIVLNTL